MYLATADGGRAITDAVTETYHLVNTGRALAGEEPVAPKNGARFHFELPGSVQGFQVDDSPESQGTAMLENTEGHSEHGSRSLAIRYQALAPGRTARVGTPTFIPSRQVAEYFEGRGYALLASPTLYSGQTLRGQVMTDADQRPRSVRANLYLRVYQDPDDHLEIVRSPSVQLAAGDCHTFTWRVPDTHGAPIAEVGVELSSDERDRRHCLPGLSHLGRRAQRHARAHAWRPGLYAPAAVRPAHVAPRLGQRHGLLRARIGRSRTG